MAIIGLDIGGANLKAAHVDGPCRSRPFALWKSPDDLPSELEKLLAELPDFDVLAVTMTAELADCYATKPEGVQHVLNSVRRVSNRPIWVWQTGAEFVSPEVANDIPLLVAAANWHALATWVGRLAPHGPSLLFDVGSTTCDLIPLLDGVPVPQGFTDRERLQSGELVYSGVRRTPVSCLAHSVPLGSGYCPLAAEVFATTRDVYTLLDQLAEDANDRDTADGRAATKAGARQRIARAVCSDSDELESTQLQQIAKFLANVQLQRITGAMDRVLRLCESDCEHVLLTGEGTFLSHQVVANHRRTRNAKHVRLEETFSPDVASAACAFAVARLAEERVV